MQKQLLVVAYRDLPIWQSRRCAYRGLDVHGLHWLQAGNLWEPQTQLDIKQFNALVLASKTQRWQGIISKCTNARRIRHAIVCLCNCDACTCQGWRGRTSSRTMRMELGFWWFPVTRMRMLPGGSHATCVLDTGMLMATSYRCLLQGLANAPIQLTPEAICDAPA